MMQPWKLRTAILLAVLVAIGIGWLVKALAGDGPGPSPLASLARLAPADSAALVAVDLRDEDVARFARTSLGGPLEPAVVRRLEHDGLPIPAGTDQADAAGLILTGNLEPVLALRLPKGAPDRRPLVRGARAVAVTQRWLLTGPAVAFRHELPIRPGGRSLHDTAGFHATDHAARDGDPGLAYYDPGALSGAAFAAAGLSGSLETGLRRLLGLSLPLPVGGPLRTVGPLHEGLQLDAHTDGCLLFTGASAVLPQQGATAGLPLEGLAQRDCDQGGLPAEVTGGVQLTAHGRVVADLDRDVLSWLEPQRVSLDRGADGRAHLVVSAGVRDAETGARRLRALQRHLAAVPGLSAHLTVKEQTDDFLRTLTVHGALAGGRTLRLQTDGLDATLDLGTRPSTRDEPRPYAIDTLAQVLGRNVTIAAVARLDSLNRLVGLPPLPAPLVLAVSRSTSGGDPTHRLRITLLPDRATGSS